jgi:Mg2+/Co2+ transporter CorB
MKEQSIELYNKNYDDGMEKVLQLKKKGKKNVKKNNKLLKEQNKQLKKIILSYKYQNIGNQNETEKPKKSFWEKIGDAIVKAVPAVLTTIVGTVLTFVFKGRSCSRSSRWNCAAGYN